METNDDQQFDCVCYKWFMPYSQYKETAFPAIFGITLSVIILYIGKCCHKSVMFFENDILSDKIRKKTRCKSFIDFIIPLEILRNIGRI